MYMYQIEVSNVCSLRCSYCPHPQQQRTKSFMSEATFRMCVELFKSCENKNELWLHNFGEALLHPKLAAFIALARERGVKCSFFTNGMQTRTHPVPSAAWRELADAGLESVSFSAHAMTVTEFGQMVGGALEIRQTFDPVAANLRSWAGQVGPAETPSAEPCLFQRHDAFVVLWDGRISSCCLDVEGFHRDLFVRDLLEGTRTYSFRSIPLCGTCSSMRAEEDM